MTEEFHKLLLEALALSGSRSALAQALGVTRSRVSGLLRRRDYSLDVEACLKLAKLLGVLDPTAILRQAGARQRRVADLLDDLYERDGKRRLTKAEREWLTDIEALDSDDRRLLHTLIRKMAKRKKV